MERVRRERQTRLLPNSGFRTKTYNATVGAAGPAHTRGYAADVPPARRHPGGASRARARVCEGGVATTRARTSCHGRDRARRATNGSAEA